MMLDGLPTDLWELSAPESYLLCHAAGGTKGIGAFTLVLKELVRASDQRPDPPNGRAPARSPLRLALRARLRDDRAARSPPIWVARSVSDDVDHYSTGKGGPAFNRP
jgi:hypothetical protein